MSDYNPYAPPESEIIEKEAPNNNEMELASRGARLGAQIIDGLIISLITIPVILFMFFSSNEFAAIENFSFNNLSLGSYVMIIGLSIVYLSIQVYFLWKDGQTLGKKALNIKIVRRNGERASLPRIIFLRQLIISALQAIPYIGSFIGLIDSLLIFRETRACLHDDFADTKVIKIN